jgi:serine/threonine protein kinase
MNCRMASKELRANTTLSHYRIVSKIGAGGMGEVYLGQDMRLDRKVALKILPADLAANQDRMRRFVQEAKAAAALNHPNRRLGELQADATRRVVPSASLAIAYSSLGENDKAFALLEKEITERNWSAPVFSVNPIGTTCVTTRASRPLFVKSSNRSWIDRLCEIVVTLKEKQS